jgi:hypothetical protein
MVDQYWPFPSQCPPVPWTAEQQRKYAEEQLKHLPDAPMVSNHS